VVGVSNKYLKVYRQETCAQQITEFRFWNELSNVEHPNTLIYSSLNFRTDKLSQNIGQGHCTIPQKGTDLQSILFCELRNEQLLFLSTLLTFTFVIKMYCEVGTKCFCI
jgi:hypothetical protein